MIDTLQCIDYNELMYSHGEDGGFYSYEVTTPLCTEPVDKSVVYVPRN
jgi:hypothetical protein